MSLVPEEIIVSVCIITFNHEKFIKQCLESVMAQETDFKFEIIVGDDCSSDKTADIVRDVIQKADMKIHLLCQKANINHGCNNYKAVHSYAKGKYIAHLDGDDIMEPGKLSAQKKYLDLNLDCSMVVHDKFCLAESGEKTFTPLRNIPEYIDLEGLLKRRCFFTHSSKMYRASILSLSKVIMQDEFIDFELHLECAANGYVGYIPLPLVTYRRVNGSISDGSPDRLFELFKYTLRGFDLAHKLGLPKSLVEREKSKYIYRSAVSFFERSHSMLVKETLKEFDTIPLANRPLLYSHILLGNYKHLRIIVVFMLAIANSASKQLHKLFGNKKL